MADSGAILTTLMPFPLQNDLIPPSACNSLSTENTLRLFVFVACTWVWVRIDRHSRRSPERKMHFSTSVYCSLSDTIMMTEICRHICWMYGHESLFPFLLIIRNPLPSWPNLEILSSVATETNNICWAPSHLRDNGPPVLVTLDNPHLPTRQHFLQNRCLKISALKAGTLIHCAHQCW